MSIRTPIAIAAAVAALLAGCHGPHFVQSDAAGAAPESVARVDALPWSAGSPGAAVFDARIVQVWDARGNKLLAATGSPYTRVTLKPGAYEVQVQCVADKGPSASLPPRVALQLAANQHFGIHCELREADKVRPVVRKLSDQLPLPPKLPPR